MGFKSLSNGNSGELIWSNGEYLMVFNLQQRFVSRSKLDLLSFFGMRCNVWIHSDKYKIKLENGSWFYVWYAYIIFFSCLFLLKWSCFIARLAHSCCRLFFPLWKRNHRVFYEIHGLFYKIISQFIGTEPFFALTKLVRIIHVIYGIENHIVDLVDVQT